jgi:NADH:ubiquinone oxidoreductase subunit E
MEKVRVKICTGTTCFIMGAAHLQRLDEVLIGPLRQAVEVEGCRCLGFCHDKSYGVPPFVMVEDERISAATIDSVITSVKRHIAERGGL